MTLDDDITPAEARRRYHEATLADDKAEWLEREATESEEAEEARWRRIFAAHPVLDREVYWPDKPGYDRRLFGP